MPIHKSNFAFPEVEHPQPFKREAFIPSVLPFLDIIDLLTIREASKDVSRKYNKIIKKHIRALLINGLSTKERIIYWKKITHIYKERQKAPQYYNNLLKNIDDRYRIAYDISRTFPDMEYFQQNKEGYSKMLNVLCAISEESNSIGYVQGMNFIAALILITHGREEDTFWLMRHIMFNPLYSYRELFTGNMLKLKILFFQLFKLVEKYLPMLYKQIIKNEVVAEAFSTSWFITFFVNELYLETSIKIFDLYLLDGWKQIFKHALSLLSQINSIKDGDDLLTQIKQVTKNIPIDDGKLFVKAASFKVTSSMLRNYQTDYFAEFNARVDPKLASKLINPMPSETQTRNKYCSFANTSSTPQLKAKKPPPIFLS